METEMIDKLFLELSQVTKATTEKEEQAERRFQLALTLLRECRNRLETIAETHPNLHLKDTIERANALLDLYPS